MKHSEIVASAIKVLNEKGWCQGGYSNASGQHCLAGALNQVIFGDGDPFSQNGILRSTDEMFAIKSQIRSAIEKKIAPVDAMIPIAKWNDAPERTQQDVVKVLDLVKTDYAKAGQ